MKGGYDLRSQTRAVSTVVEDFACSRCLITLKSYSQIGGAQEPHIENEQRHLLKRLKSDTLNLENPVRDMQAI